MTAYCITYRTSRGGISDCTIKAGSEAEAVSYFYRHFDGRIISVS